MASDSEASFGGFDLDDVGSILDNFDNFESDVDVSSVSSNGTDISVDEDDVFPSDIDAGEDLVPGDFPEATDDVDNSEWKAVVRPLPIIRFNEATGPAVDRDISQVTKRMYVLV